MTTEPTGPCLSIQVVQLVDHHLHRAPAHVGDVGVLVAEHALPGAHAAGEDGGHGRRAPAALGLQRPVELARQLPTGRLGPQACGRSWATRPWIWRRRPRSRAGKACGSLTRSTMTFSPGPWQILSNSCTAVISSSATVACMPPASTRPLGLTSLKILRGAIGHRKGVAAHVHDAACRSRPACLRTWSHVVQARVEARSVIDAVLVQDGAQQAQAVVLPLLVRPGRVDQVAQVAQVEPQAARAGRSVEACA